MPNPFIKNKDNLTDAEAYARLMAMASQMQRPTYTEIDPVKARMTAAEAVTPPAAPTYTPRQYTPVRDPVQIRALGASVPTPMNDYDMDKGTVYGLGRGTFQLGQSLGMIPAALERVAGGVIDLAKGDPFGTAGKRGPTNRWLEDIKRNAELWDEQYAENEAKANALQKAYGDVITALPGAAVQGAGAIAAAAAKAPTTMGALQRGFAYMQNPNLVNSLQNVAGNMVRNPNYWMAYAQAFGDSVQQAEDDGADFLRALTYGVGNASINAAMEMGGVQELPEKLNAGANPLVEALKSAPEEGLEEVGQGVYERALQNLFYGAKNPVLSTTDERAIINPVTSMKEFGVGTAVGALMSGGQVMANEVINNRSKGAKEAIHDALVDNGVSEEAASAVSEVLDAQRRGETPSEAQLTAVQSNPEAARVMETIGQPVQQSAQPIQQNVQREANIQRETQPAAQESAEAVEVKRAALREMGESLGENGSKSLVAAYKGGDMVQYADDFTRVYNAAREGKQADTGSLNQAQYFAAASAGSNDFVAAEQSKESGLVADHETRQRLGRTAEQIDRFGRLTGTRIVMRSSVTAGMANGEHNGRVIMIAKDAQNPVLQVLGHEIGHHIRENTQESYTRLLRALKAMDKGFDAKVLARMAEYQQQGVKLSRAKAEVEIANDRIGEMLDDGKLLDEFIRRSDRSTLEKFRDAIREFIGKVKDIFSTQDVRKLHEAERKLMAALEATSENAQKNNAQMGASYMIKNVEFEENAKAFAEDVRDWYDENMPDGERFVLGSTGNVIQGLGAIEQDIYINGDKIKSILDKHGENGMTIDTIMQIPEILNDPTLVLKAKVDGKARKGSTRMVLFGSVKVNGIPVLTLLDLKPVENHIVINDMQKVTSAYIKTTDPVGFIRNSEVMYADKKRATRTLNAIGFQMPIESVRNGFLGSITYSGPDVNLKGEKFSNIFRETRRDKSNYSLKAVVPVQPQGEKWGRSIDTEEAKRRFPNLWDVAADSSEVRNPTQISTTVKTYRKVYDLLKAEGFDGKILDASSGLGYGTKAGIEEYGFDVEDIEPYPDSQYSPKYTDYSALDEKYDAIISNAVLNVLPQDQRDALVVKMGQLLKDGGKMYINVRGKDVDTLGNNSANTNIGPMEWYVESTGSYQKGFTPAELEAYLQDALGPGFTVKRTSKFGGVAAIVERHTAQTVADSVFGENTREESGVLVNELGEVTHPEMQSFSLKTGGDALGVSIERGDEGNYFVNDKDGNRVEKFVVDTSGKRGEVGVRETPMGRMVQLAQHNRFISGEEVEKQLQFLADLGNMLIEHQNQPYVWEFAGAEFMSAMQSNSDPQYGTTVDFGTICKKTQAVIDAMSETMLRLKRGLTVKEVMTVYRETAKVGESVPCPVCYVFSRWIGAGGIIENINKFQKKYGNMSYEELTAATKGVRDAVTNKVAEYRRKNPGKELPKAWTKKGGEVSVAKVVSTIRTSYNNQVEALERQMAQAEADGNKAKFNELDSQRSALLDKALPFEAYSWINMAKLNKAGTGLNPSYKPVPDEILFNLNKGAAFSKGYPATWKYRTTRGNAAGKAIIPYTDYKIGDLLAGIKSGKSNPKNLAFLKDDKRSKTRQRSIVRNALKTVRAQNLIGGQRYQSTSDFRYEYGLDYLMSFFEMQAVGSKVQMYTKVIEAVDFLCSAGVDLNLSVMPLGKGYSGKRLLFSNVTGINAEAAEQMTKKYDNAQMIMVGISDEHIRLCLASDGKGENPRIDFVIPYHASGGRNSTITEFMRILGEHIKSRELVDYAVVENDVPDPNATREQVERRKAREAILTGKANEGMMDVIESSAYLSDLYRRFYVDEGAAEYGAFLTSSQAGKIYPFEYWDKSLRYEQADMNGERFKAYCEEMGLIPRFSGKAVVGGKVVDIDHGNFANDKGYWKTLIDRRMYNNDGSFHEQRRINVTGIDMETLDPDYGERHWGAEGDMVKDAMSKGIDTSKTSRIADAVVDSIENGTSYSLKAFNDGTRFVDLDINPDISRFDGLNPKEQARLATKVIKERFAGKVIGIDNPVFVNGHGAAEYGHPVKRNQGAIHDAKMRASLELDNLVDAGGAVTTAQDGADGHSHPNAVGDFQYREAIFKVGNEYYLARVNALPVAKGLLFKDVTQIKNITQDIYSSYGKNPKSIFLRDVSMTAGSGKSDTPTVNQIVTSPAQMSSGNSEDFSLKTSKALAAEVRRLADQAQQENWSEAQLSEAINRVVEETYDTMRKTNGTIHPGENAYREVSVPKRTDPKTKVSQTVRTVLEAEATPDGMVPTIEKATAMGDFDYDPFSDADATAKARKTIERMGWDKAQRDWFDDMKKGKVNKANTAMGWTLYNNAATSGNTDLALDILNAMVEHQRNAAQALQASRILKKLSPEGQLYGVKKSVEQLQKELNDRFGDGKVKLKIDEELAGKLLKAKDEDTRAKAMQDIYRDIGRQMPSRFVDKWNAWRYLAMLGNPRTHIRNIVGNAGFAPVVAAKNLTGSAIEAAVSAVTGGKIQRTKAVTFDKGLLQAAFNDFTNVADTAMGGGKYSEFQNANKYIEEGRQVFKFKPLEAARKANSWALDIEDQWFSRPHYAAAMASFCKANHITAEDIKSGKGIAAARSYAIKEAQKATYRDTNAFSQFVSSLGRSQNAKGVRKAANTVVEGILPFRKTPANILARGVEYSPLGLVKSLSYDLVQVRKGKITAAEAIDHISAGLTGTGLLALGAFLAAQGLVRGGADDDKRKRDFDKMQGHQNYSLELPDGTSATLDYLAPAALPFFVGVNLYQNAVKEKDGVTLSSLLTSVSQISEPMLEMSCLQSLNDVFESVQYASNKGLSGLTSVLASAATSYLTQGVPTIGGQIERTGQDERMTTYTQKNAFLTNDLQRTIGNVSAKIPGWDYQQIPYIDAWGRTESTGPAAQRAFNNLLNPAYTAKVETDATEKELLRLYDKTGEGKVFPNRADKSFKAEGEELNLDKDQYVSYATKKGQVSKKIVDSMVKNSGYSKLSDEEKATVIADAYEYANVVAKMSVGKYTSQEWAKAVDAEKQGIDPANYILIRKQKGGIESLKDADGNTITNSKGLLVMEMINNSALPAAQREAMYGYMGVGKTIIGYSPAKVSEELARMRRGG